MTSTWNLKKRLAAYTGLALGFGVATGAVRLLEYVVSLPPWPWLRTALALLFFAVWIWPIALGLFVWANFYCAITREDPGFWFWMLLLPPIQRRVIRIHTE